MNIRNQYALPICITLVKQVQENYDEPFVNASIQFKTVIDKREDVKSQVFKYLKDKEIFVGLVKIIVSGFDKEILIKMMNEPVAHNRVILIKDFSASESKLYDFDVWIKKQVDIQEV